MNIENLMGQSVFIINSFLLHTNTGLGKIQFLEFLVILLTTNSHAV